MGCKENDQNDLWAACASGRAETIQWLLTHRPEYKTLIKSIHVEIMMLKSVAFFQWLEANVAKVPYTARVMDYAAGSGHLALVQYVHLNRPEGCSPVAMDLAAVNGHLDIVQFLHEKQDNWISFSFSTRTGPKAVTQAMDDAAAYGRLDVIRFLHDYRTEGCTTKAMDRTTSLDVIRFLHENRTEGCTTDAMDRAAFDGRLDRVQFLHENRTEGCTTEALDYAIANGHLDVVRFLLKHRKERCSAKAMNLTARNGHLESVEFVHARGIKSNYSLAVEEAARGGHLEIIQYFVEQFPSRITKTAMENAAKEGHLPIVALLHDTFHKKRCSRQAMAEAALSGHFQIVKYLNETCGRGGKLALERAAKHGCLKMVRYLVEMRTDGCLIDARYTAHTWGHPLVEDYLTSVINPFMEYTEEHWDCEDQRIRRCSLDYCAV